MSKRSPTRGFTLVELLVVIAIIGILVSITIPAVQSGREASRRTQCANNLKQLTTASLTHNDAQNCYPTGGWGHGWIGDPDQGFGYKQPGAWIYSILPYTEESTLHSLGKGGTKAEKIAAGQKQMQTPLPFLNCPSRRQPILYPVRPGTVNYNDIAILRPDLVAKTCYAKNGGNDWYGFVQGPGTIAGAKTFGWPPMSKSTGVDWWYMAFKPSQIRDGTSKTFFYGEKHINFQFYDTWQGGGDASTMYEGFDLEATRYAGPTYPLVQDTIEGIDQLTDTPQFKSFGGPHSGIVQFAFCDGSIKPIRTEIDSETLRRLANRHDGLEINEAY